MTVTARNRRIGPIKQNATKADDEEEYDSCALRQHQQQPLKFREARCQTRALGFLVKFWPRSAWSGRIWCCHTDTKTILIRSRNRRLERIARVVMRAGPDVKSRRDSCLAPSLQIIENPLSSAYSIMKRDETELPGRVSQHSRSLSNCPLLSH